MYTHSYCVVSKNKQLTGRAFPAVSGMATGNPNDQISMTLLKHDT